MPSTRRIVDIELFAHFLTFSVFRRRRLFSHDQPKRILLGVLNDELVARDARCVGFVVMPDHVHAIVWLPKPGRDHAPNYFVGFGEGARFWQPKYYPFELYSSRKAEEKVQYMHENPMRAGLVQRAVDWPWSSARWYLEHKSVGVPIHWIDF